jgi:hypothetical protein
MSSKIAAEGSAAIVTECATQSFENASKGLIVSETGLHEDVFALRDRASYAVTAFGLDDALRLEALLESDAKAGGQPIAQRSCIEEFEKHLETLTGPMVEQDRLEKQIDTSAFNDSTKQAQEQTKREQSKEIGKIP